MSGRVNEIDNVCVWVYLPRSMSMWKREREREVIKKRKHLILVASDTLMQYFLPRPSETFPGLYLP